jgi:hypothetical protein
MTQTLIEIYSKELQQEQFGALVAARVNEILSGNAKVLEFEKAGGIFNTAEQEALLFADTIAQVVCANLNRGE